MNFDLDDGDAGPVFVDQGVAAIPEDKAIGRFVGEVQRTDGSYVAYSYGGNSGRIVACLGAFNMLDDALWAFTQERLNHRTETARPTPVLIRRRMREAAA